MNSAASFIIVSALTGVCEQRNQQRPSLINFQAIEIDAMCGHGNGLQAKKSDIGTKRSRRVLYRSLLLQIRLSSRYFGFREKSLRVSGRHFRPNTGAKPNRGSVRLAKRRFGDSKAAASGGMLTTVKSWKEAATRARRVLGAAKHAHIRTAGSGSAGGLSLICLRKLP